VSEIEMTGQAIGTRAAARIIGPYLMLMAATLFARREELASLLPEFMANDALVLATGAFTLMAGLIILALHPYWRGPVAFAVSFVGLAASLKGGWLMVAPHWGAAATDAFVRTPFALEASAGVEFVVGLWLAYVGWLSQR
jgi:hypothetical protein